MNKKSLPQRPTDFDDLPDEVREEVPRKARPKDPTNFDDLADGALVRVTLLIRNKVVPFSRSTLLRKVHQGVFPAPIKISCNITAWRVGEIRNYLKDPIHFSTSSKVPEKASPPTGRKYS